jgi:putative sigma-54 modulation protein
MSNKTNLHFLLKGLKIDQRTKDYVEKKLEKLDKFLEKILGIEIEIEKDKRKFFRVKITVKNSGSCYLAEEISESIEGSLDMALEKIQQQIRKEKGKLMTMRKRGARSIKKKIVIDSKARF